MKKMILGIVATATLVSILNASDSYTCTVYDSEDKKMLKELNVKHPKLNHRDDIIALKHATGYKIQGKQYGLINTLFKDNGMTTTTVYQGKDDMYVVLVEDGTTALKILSGQTTVADSAGIVLSIMTAKNGKATEMVMYKCAKLTHEEEVIYKLK